MNNSGKISQAIKDSTFNPAYQVQGLSIQVGSLVSVNITAGNDWLYYLVTDFKGDIITRTPYKDGRYYSEDLNDLLALAMHILVLADNAK